MALFCFIDQLFRLICYGSVDENTRIDGGLENGMVYIINFLSHLYFLYSIVILLSLYNLNKDSENLFLIQNNFFIKILKTNPPPETIN